MARPLAEITYFFNRQTQNKKVITLRSLEHDTFREKFIGENEIF